MTTTNDIATQSISMLPATTAPAAPPRAPARSRRSSEITVTVSDRWEDVSEALGVVHDGFVEAGYMSPQRSGKRMISQYLNPGATFLVARWGGETVGVLAVIPDGPFGLPSDRSFREELEEIRASGEPLFEVGSFVVRRAWRRHTRQIAAGLFSAAIRVMRDTPGFRVLISVEPRQENFYRSTIGGEIISEPRPLYGAPAIALLSSYVEMLDAMGSENTNGQRLIRDMVLGSGEEWFVDRRAGAPWPWLHVSPLVMEQGALSTLFAQMDALRGAMEVAA